MKKKIAPPGVVCHGLQENAFQVNQLYNVTWSTVHIESFQVILMVFASVGGLLAIILLLTIVLACCFANQIEKFEAEDNYYNNDARDEYCQQYNAQSYPPRPSRPSTPSQSRRGNTGETTC